MRIFEYYNPLKVSKYIKNLFDGRLYIKDISGFKFEKWKILMPKIHDNRHFSMMLKVNRQVLLLQSEIG
ncbi:MAG: DUF1107 family protein [Serratia symbiotica]|nr:DUF1107 family protein [Serratia symbiotica]